MKSCEIRDCDLCHFQASDGKPECHKTIKLEKGDYNPKYHILLFT
jgi:hypothetical protein